jgi:hypothetical protein
VAKEPKGAPKSWKNSSPLNWGQGSTTSFQVEPENIMLQPGKFDEVAPVGRPDVPEIEEQLPPQVTDNSIIGGFLNVMDNIVPDDLGGMIRGESGPLSNLPLYRETVGTALGVPISGAESVINAVNWGSEQMNHLGAALMSALPGGIQTLDWDQSQDISLGQVVAANAAINNSRGFGGFLINAATLQAPFSIAAWAGEKQDPDNVLYSENFDILNKEERAQAFESGGLGQVTSGFADAIWMVAADPTIVGGKATSILRLGTKAGNFGGFSNQALRSTEQIQRFSNVTEEQGKLISELGIEGARKSGRLTAEGENLIRAMEQNADELVNHPWVVSSPSQRDTRALLGSTSIEDPIGASYLTGALAGNADSWAKLRTHDAQTYIKAADAFGVDVFGPVGDAVYDTARAGVLLTDDQIKLGDDFIIEMLAQRPDLLPKIKPEQIAAGQKIVRGGSRLSPRTVRAANAWRTGAARNQFENNAFKKSSSSAVTATSRGHYVYDTIQGIAGSRPLQVVRWLGQGTPTGVINIKNGPDSNMVLRNVSSWLRKSPIGQEEGSIYLNRFAAARTPGERSAILAEMEESAARLIAQKHGISETSAMEAYKGYNRRRMSFIENVRKSDTKFAIDPDTGKPVVVPDFYAEIDPAYAMLDTKVFDRVIGGNKSWLRTVEDVEFIADELNKYWKLSVLLRLGYTQRNIAEGALRSFAVLGIVAANPKAFANVPGNAYNYVGAAKATRKARIKERSLIASYENLQAARNLIFKNDEMARLIDQTKIAEEKIARIQGSVPNGKKLSAKQSSEIAKLKDSIKKSNDRVKELDKELGPGAGANLIAAEQQVAKQLAEIDSLSSGIEELLSVARAKTARRKRGGYGENIVGGQRLQGAFQGGEGAIAAKAAAADRTTYMAIDSAFGRRVNQLESSSEFSVIDPATLKPNQMQTYFDEYALRINYRYREDPVGRMILANEPLDKVRAWIYSDAGKGYRESMSLSGRRLDSTEAVDEWLDHIIRRLDNEMPKDTKLRSLALDHELTPAEVASALRGRQLPTIVGRLEDDLPSSIFPKAKRGVDTLTDAIMRGIGSFPETKLLRHPFYNRVYMDRQAQLWRVAADQGADMADPIVKNRINRSAHDSALKATRETLYTIEELSNAAVMLRYVSPFFPAFENSLRTWGRIAWNNPAVIGYGNILWNIPNNLGWVVDEYGEKVEKSNFFIDENHFVIWPQPVADFIRSMNGPFTPGEALRTRQHGANVIFQGGQWWFPGAGPATSIPLAFALRGKPEDAEALRNAVGDEIFNQLVPSGNPNADLVDSLLPTVARRIKQMWQGESSDQAFLSTWNQIIEDEYIAAQLEGRTFTEADAKRVKEKTDRFWGWQIAAAVAAPFQSSISSRFQPQRDFWNKLIDDQSLSYPEKIKALEDKFPEFGDALLAITRAGTFSETKLQPNLKTWQRIYKNKDIVNNLYAIDPELVGMFGNMGSFDDPFSRAVYGEFGAMEIGPNDARVRRMMRPDEIVRNNQIKDGWTEYWLIKDYAEDRAMKLGYSSLEVKEAKPFRDELDAAAMQIADRYPAWGEERKLYEDKLPAFIQGARVIVQNAELMEEDSTVSALAEYLEIRDEASSLLQGVTDDDVREQIKIAAYEGAWQLRQKDIGFADFYDQYLYRDDFRKI